MDKSFFIRLTFAVHRVLDRLPKREALRNEIEILANEVLADLICSKPEVDKIEKLDKLFSEAKDKNWINPANFLILKREYAKIREYFGKEKKELSLEQKAEQKPGIQTRQGLILQAVGSNGRTRLGDLMCLLPGIHRRTILRDVDKLVSSGAIIRNGDGRGTYYQPNGLGHPKSTY